MMTTTNSHWAPSAPTPVHGFPSHDGSSGRVRELPSPVEIGRPLSASGLSEAEAKEAGRGASVFVGIVLGLVAGGATLFGAQYMLYHALYPMRGPLSGDWVYEACIAAAVVALGVIAFFVVRGMGKEHPGSIEWVGTDGIAEIEMLHRRATKVKIVRFADVRLEMVRHGKYGRYLRKTWTFFGHSRAPIHTISGEGFMDSFSADPSRATARDSTWAYASAALSALESFRSFGPR